jgi:hypothetical protein
MDDRKPKSPAERARESRQRRAKAGEPLPAVFDQVFRDTALLEYQAGNFNVDLNDLIASTVDELVTKHKCTSAGCRKVLDTLFDRVTPC